MGFDRCSHTIGLNLLAEDDEALSNLVKEVMFLPKVILQFDNIIDISTSIFMTFCQSYESKPQKRS